MYNYDYPLMHGNDQGWGFGMAIVCLLLTALLVTVIVQFFRRHYDHQPDTSKSSPNDIIDERYAKGEITKLEFDQYKKDLK